MKRFICYSVAAVLITLLVILLLPAISSTGHPTRQRQCRFEMTLISDALKDFQKEKGEYPTGTTENIIKQLSKTNAQGNSFLNYPYREGFGRYEFVDPWGKPFQIEIGSRSNYVIRSAGRNGNFADGDDVVFNSASNSFMNP